MKLLSVNRWFIVLALLFLLLPEAGFACDKCFGGAAVNTPVTRGISLAMMLLLGITGGVLSGIVAFFVYLWRRTKLFEAGKLIVTEQGNMISHQKLLQNIHHPDR